MASRAFYLLLIFCIVLASCASHTYDDVAEQEQTPPPPETVTYQDTKSIFDNNCVQCHGNPPINGATNGLTNYDQVSDADLDAWAEHTSGQFSRRTFPGTHFFLNETARCNRIVMVPILSKGVDVKCLHIVRDKDLSLRNNSSILNFYFIS